MDTGTIMVCWVAMVGKTGTTMVGWVAKVGKTGITMVGWVAKVGEWERQGGNGCVHSSVDPSKRHTTRPSYREEYVKNRGSDGQLG